MREGLLEFAEQGNSWDPPAADLQELARAVIKERRLPCGVPFLYLFRTEPYIDSVYFIPDEAGEPSGIKRFVFHDGYSWSREDEDFFSVRCVRSVRCRFYGGDLDRIFEKYREENPQWHLQRYYTHGLRMLDHIYHCLKKNTAKEMLYKAGLDELAVRIDDIDELNLLAGRPSELYDGLSIKMLRSLNCPDGAALLCVAAVRKLLKNLNMTFPEIFRNRLNDAQCRYLGFLIRGDLTVGEVGRLYNARRDELAKMWVRTQFDLFLLQEKREKKTAELCHAFGKIDPIYVEYIREADSAEEDFNIRRLEYYLLLNRKEYDRKIRRSNRKRNPDWEERGEKYYIRYPQTINDFCRESLYMRNCLLTYAEAMIRNETTILFMRESDSFNKPFITIEIFDGQLMQAYHRFNKDCTPEEARWIREYCARHGIGTDKFQFDAARDLLF